MQVSEAMTRNVRIANPSETIQEVARVMAEIDAGFMPVGDNDRLVGTITDRDIAVRAIAAGRGPDTKVSDVMTKDVKYCFDDDDVDNVCRNMSDQQVRRMPVVNRDKRLVGVISLGDLAIDGESEDQAAEALSGVSRPGGPHSQTGQRPV